jgi:hypothetical protein
MGKVHRISAAIPRGESFQPSGAPLELVGARRLLECVFRAEGVASGRHGRLGQDAQRPVEPGENGAGAAEVCGEASVDVLGDAGVEDAAPAFEDVEPPCFGARAALHGRRFTGFAMASARADALEEALNKRSLEGRIGLGKAESLVQILDGLRIAADAEECADGVGALLQHFACREDLAA